VHDGCVRLFSANESVPDPERIFALRDDSVPLLLNQASNGTAPFRSAPEPNTA